MPLLDHSLSPQMERELSDLPSIRRRCRPETPSTLLATTVAVTVSSLKLASGWVFKTRSGFCLILEAKFGLVLDLKSKNRDSDTVLFCFVCSG